MTMTTPTYGRPTRPRRLIAAARRDPLLTIGLGIVALSIFLALFGTVIAPKSPTEPTGAPSEHPSLSHWMGTDASGLDVFSQVISAPRTDVVLAVSAALVSSVLGTLIGLTAGYFRTWWAEVVMRISDVIQAFPVFILGMMLVALSGRNTGNLIVALSLLYTPIFIRLTRAEVLTQRNRSYVESARAMGNSEWRIAFRHVLPNSLAPSLIQLSVTVGFGILLTAGLSYVGAGVRPPTPEWFLHPNQIR